MHVRACSTIYDRGGLNHSKNRDVAQQQTTARYEMPQAVNHKRVERLYAEEKTGASPQAKEGARVGSPAAGAAVGG